ncbi:MAG: DUF5719 family protein [Lacisediminihabitans sp.]
MSEPDSGMPGSGVPDSGGSAGTEPQSSVPESSLADNSMPESSLPDSSEPGSRTRGAIRVGARIVAGTVGLAVAAVTVAAAGWLPLPTLSTKPPVASVIPVAAAQQRVCAGPLLRLGNDSGKGATTVSSVGNPQVRFAASAGRVEAAPLASTDNTSGVAPLALILPPGAGNTAAPPLLAGSQTQSAAAGELVGLAAAECTEASGDSWLVGGATTTGRTTLLSLSNPSNVIATVRLTIFAERGAIAAAGTDGIVVPPRGQRILSLAGFAPGIVSPVVHVQSRGGQVVANLQQAIVRTLEPGGVSVVGATTGPSKTTVIPGLILANSAAVVARAGDPSYADLRTVIRLFVPGSTPAKTELIIEPEGGAAPATTVRVVVSAGVVTEVPLDSFHDGAYTVTIRSDAPLVAGARASTIGASGGTDFEWIAAAPAITAEALVAVAAGPSPALHLSNPTGTDAVATLSAPGAATVSVTIPAGKAVAMPVAASTTYTVTGFTTLMASVSYLGDGALAGFQVTPTGPRAQPITVYP